MPTYMTQFSHTHDAVLRLAKNPEDRSVPVRALAEKLGGTFIGMYYTTGDYDGLVIFEAADAQMAGTLVLAVSLPGHLSRTRTTQLFTVAEGMEMMGAAGQHSYPGPRG